MAFLAAIPALIVSAADAIGTAAVTVGSTVGTAVEAGAGAIGIGAADAGAAGLSATDLGFAGAGTAGEVAGLTTAEGLSAAGITGATAAGASSLPGWLALASTGASLAGGVVGAIGAEQSAAAQAQAAKYNSAIASQNEQIANQNSALAMRAGEAQVGIQGQKQRQVMGGIIAQQAASGVELGSGSNLQVQESQRELGGLDLLTTQSNAAKQAFGYETEALGFKAEQQLNTAQAQADLTAGNIQAGSTLLGSTGNAASNYLRYLQASGFGSQTNNSFSGFSG